MTEPTEQNTSSSPADITGHGGVHVVEAARAYGVSTLFTLSGAHVFPVYDAAVGGKEAVAAAVDSGAAAAGGPLRLIDVRHEQTAVFAAEATAKLTRTPGLAVLTAGPGVTNGISAVTSAHFNGSPIVVLGGRAPDSRWGSGALQELDQPPLLAPITKLASTVHDPAGTGQALDAAFRLATSPHRGPVFVDVPMDVLFTPAQAAAPVGGSMPGDQPDPDALTAVAELLAQARHPVLVIGGDVWADGAEIAAARCARTLGLPVIANGMGRGILAADDPLLVTRARSRAFGAADLVLVAGTPLDFRLGYGAFGGRDGAPAAQVVHLVDSALEVARHLPLAIGIGAALTATFDGLTQAWEQRTGRISYADWLGELRAVADRARAADAADLGSTADPIHPERIYGELVPRLAEDAVVIGDGGDFVSFAGKYVEPARPGGWLDPGPYGCLGTGLGYAMAARIARPSAQIVLLLGDGAAGFSLMDVDTLVRHDLPVVMVVGNNSGWALEKHPMRFLYGYDVAAQLRPTAYDEVVRALGGAGESVSRPGDIGPAMDRAFAAGVPYLINVHTDPAIAYPRSTTGV